MVWYFDPNKQCPGLLWHTLMAAHWLTGLTSFTQACAERHALCIANWPGIEKENSLNKGDSVWDLCSVMSGTVSASLCQHAGTGEGEWEL